jgi:hypothetical protein
VGHREGTEEDPIIEVEGLPGDVGGKLGNEGLEGECEEERPQGVALLSPLIAGEV